MQLTNSTVSPDNSLAGLLATGQTATAPQEGAGSALSFESVFSDLTSETSGAETGRQSEAEAAAPGAMEAGALMASAMIMPAHFYTNMAEEALPTLTAGAEGESPVEMESALPEGAEVTSNAMTQPSLEGGHSSGKKRALAFGGRAMDDAAVALKAEGKMEGADISEGRFFRGRRHSERTDAESARPVPAVPGQSPAEMGVVGSAGHSAAGLVSVADRRLESANASSETGKVAGDKPVKLFPSVAMAFRTPAYSTHLRLQSEGIASQAQGGGPENFIAKVGNLAADALPLAGTEGTNAIPAGLEPIAGAVPFAGTESDVARQGAVDTAPLAWDGRGLPAKSADTARLNPNMPMEAARQVASPVAVAHAAEASALHQTKAVNVVHGGDQVRETLPMMAVSNGPKEGNAGRAEPTVARAEANIAEGAAPMLEQQSRNDRGDNNNSHHNDGKRVKNDDLGYGTRIAKDFDSMPELSSQRPAATDSQGLSATAHALEAAGRGVKADVTEPMVAEMVPVSSAGAVEAVLKAAERASLEGRHRVDLQFSVGGESLSVRVELRADEVRTTFRTDSPELRQALAQEWQTLSSESGDRMSRMTDPVFSSREAATSLSGGFSGGASQHRDAQSQRPTAEGFAAMMPRMREAAATAAATISSAGASTTRSPALPTVRHLHALA